MKIERFWAMPNKQTFEITPIKKLVSRLIVEKHAEARALDDSIIIIDPFSSISKIAMITNDIDPAANADYCMEALDFLKMFSSERVDVVLFDPPYSPRQVSESYKKLGKSVNMQTTQASYWSSLKKEIARITRTNGIVITCGWNSGGIGKNLGFEIEEILMVAHGGWHNDTIVTVDRKMPK